jgi:hypothetical protein
MRLNGWTEADANDYVELAFEIWGFRSSVPWQLVLRWLARHGVSGPIH